MKPALHHYLAIYSSIKNTVLSDNSIFNCISNSGIEQSVNDFVMNLLDK